MIIALVPKGLLEGVDEIAVPGKELRFVVGIL